MRPSLYEFAGGAKAFEPFADALHARCLAQQPGRLVIEVDAVTVLAHC
jgi:hypothetical protein